MNKIIVFAMIVFASVASASANSCGTTIVAIEHDTLFDVVVSDSIVLLNNKSDSLFQKKITINNDQKKKWIAALFAFPFPFGFMGAHRIMLGTKPWVPVVYVFTFGGCFGLLPMIDFCVIMFSKDITQYENNPNIFMWIK